MADKWIVESSRIVSKGHIFHYCQNESRSLESGKQGTFDIIKSVPWVNVIALDEEGEVILVKQFRHGTEEMTLEIPGGGVSRGEEILLAAKRELQEETGYTSNEWTFLGEVTANPAFMNNKCTTYLARNCKKTHEQNLDPLEEVEVVKLPLEKVITMVNEGEIQHSLVVAAFGMAKLKGEI